MICNAINRKIQKINLSQQYKQRFIQVLQQIQSKYSSQKLNKALIIKKICSKYLKICNNLISPLNIQHSINALELIKSIQFEIYEGKSYEIYLIKINLHLLMVKCYDLKIKNCQYQEEEFGFKKKKYLYVERLKIFVDQLEKSYFIELLFKDYYSNLELILFHIIKHDLEQTLQKTNLYEIQTQTILTDLESTKKCINKVFQNLKCHILQLNEMLFYLQKKVYQNLTAKVKLMIELFVIQAQTFFMQEVGEQFSDAEWEIYREFLNQEGKNQIIQSKTTMIGPPKTSKSFRSNYAIDKNMIKGKQDKQANQQSYSWNQGGNYQNISYESIKSRFMNQIIDQLWQKYDSIFNKIPNNIHQAQVFVKVQTILGSFIQKKKAIRSQRKLARTTINNIQSQQDLLQLDGQDLLNNSQKSDSIENIDKQVREDQQSQLGQIQEVKKTKKKRVQISKRSNYKREKNQQLQEFIDFLKDDKKQRFFPELKLPVQMNKNASQKLTNLKRKSPLSQNPQYSEHEQKPIHPKTNQDDEDEGQSAQQTEQIMNSLQRTKMAQNLTTKQSPKAVIKKSNFGVFKDMKNVFQFISQKHKNQQKYKLNLVRSSEMGVQKPCVRFNSEGFKKLNNVKNVDLGFLKVLKQNQFERLRRIKSTQILSLTKAENSKKNLQKIGRNRSKTVYFPFMKENSSKMKTQQAQKVFDLPKLSKKSSKINVLSTDKPGQLKLTQSSKLRISDNKKTTLDDIEIGRINQILNLKQEQQGQSADLIKSNNQINENQSFQVTPNKNYRTDADFQDKNISQHHNQIIFN